MTAPHYQSAGSGRPSDRVETQPSAHPGIRGPQPIAAPESMALAAVAGRPSVTEGADVFDGCLDLPGMALSQRERAILTSLSAHAFLTADQLRRLHFAEHATPDAAARICRRVLQRLADRHLIEHLERRIGGVRAGSNSFIWRLGPVGDRLLRQASGVGVRARRKEPSAYYLDHRLAVAEVDVRLRDAARDGRLELLEVVTEPANWRPFLGDQAARLILKPDLYAVTASDEYEDSWFIEVDRGTESIPTLIRKCAQYEAYRRSGHEQQRSDGVFPLVVWQLPHAARLTKLAAAIRASRLLDARLYRLTTPDGLLRLVIDGGAG